MPGASNSRFALFYEEHYCILCSLANTKRKVGLKTIHVNYVPYV